MRSIFVALALFVAAAPASADPLVYVVTANQQFGVVNLSSGAFSPIGPATSEGQSNLVWHGGQLYSLTYSGNLETIDPKTGLTTVVGATGLGYNAFDLAGSRSGLYATDFSNNLYRLDPGTGAAQLINATGMPPEPDVPFSMNADGTLNLCDETLYGIAGRLYATFDTFDLDPATLTITPKVSPYLYAIDPSTGIAERIAPTSLNLGASVEVGGRVLVFEVVATGFTPFGPTLQSQVERLDLNTGATRFITSVDPAAGGIFGAAPVVPDDEY